MSGISCVGRHSALLGAFVLGFMFLSAGNAQADSCDSYECPDLREILNPAPSMMGGFPGAAPPRGVQLASNRQTAVPPAVPQMRFRQFVQARPAAPPPPKPAVPPVQANAAAAQIDMRGVNEWAAQCPPNQVTGCEIVRRVVRQDGQPLVSLLVGPDPRVPGRNQALILLPLGVAVRESVPMLLDDKFIALMPIEACVAAGCLMRLALSPPIVGLLRAGTVLKFLALTPEGQTVPLSIPIGGFGEAFQKVAG